MIKWYSLTNNNRWASLRVDVLGDDVDAVVVMIWVLVLVVAVIVIKMVVVTVVVVTVDVELVGEIISHFPVSISSKAIDTGTDCCWLI